MSQGRKLCQRERQIEHPPSFATRRINGNRSIVATAQNRVHQAGQYAGRANFQKRADTVGVHLFNFTDKIHGAGQLGRQ